MAAPAEPLAKLFLRFVRFGFLAWGGPVAQIAMIRQELVEREGWVSSERFNRVLAVYQALPGPEATELCVYFGQLARGRLGGLLAGLGFLLPGFLLVLGLAWAYTSLDLRGPALAGLFAGMKAAVAALVLRGVERVGRHALTERALWAIAAVAFAAEAAGVHFAVVIVWAGLAHAALRRRAWPVAAGLTLAAAAAALLVPGLSAPAQTLAGQVGAPGEASLPQLAGMGLAAGALTFGGAYTAIPLVRDLAVGRAGWVTTPQFLDSLAFAGIVPAPLVMFTTFLGYIGGGGLGAIVVTVAVFLPAFAFTLAGFRHLERAVADPRTHDLLDGVAAGVVGLVAATAVALLASAVPSFAAAALAVAALVALFVSRSRATVPMVMLGAGLVGVLALRG